MTEVLKSTAGQEYFRELGASLGSAISGINAFVKANWDGIAATVEWTAKFFLLKFVITEIAVAIPLLAAAHTWAVASMTAGVGLLSAAWTLTKTTMLVLDAATMGYVGRAIIAMKGLVVMQGAVAAGWLAQTAVV